jgi:arsenate reductase
VSGCALEEREEAKKAMTKPPTVLFVCLHGSAKSVIAVEHFRRLAAERGIAVDADSAGTEPDADVPPRVVQGLLAEGIDVRGRRPRPVTRADLERASRVVTFGCELSDLAPPGLSVERWDDVPAVSEDFKTARDVIVSRLPRLLDECLKPS